MKRNLFEVGEIVILESKFYPELNGEYPVLAVEWSDGVCTTTLNYLPEAFGYELPVTTVAGGLWEESALRKKHRPSSEDFQSMMDTLKTNIVGNVE